MTISARHLALAGFALVALVALVAGCSPASAEEMALAADGTEAMQSSQQSTHLAGVVFESVTQADPSKAAAQVTGSAAGLWPAGCATRAKDPTDPRVTHVTFKDCAGPFGLAHLDGEVVVTFSAGTGGALHVQLGGVNLSAAGHAAAYSATADVTIAGAIRRIVWQGSWTRLDAAGRTLAHTSDLNLDADTTTGCRTANGTAKTTLGTREIDTTLSDYVVCRNRNGEEACPSGTVTHTAKVSGASVTLKLDGTATAEVTGPLGHTFRVSLACPAADMVGK